MNWLWRKDSNLRMAALTVRCLTNLATPQKVNLAAATRLELASSRLQDERSVIQLSYAAIWWTGRDSNPHKKFAGLLCCRYITSPGKFRVSSWVRPEFANSKLKTRNSKLVLVAVGGVEPPTSRL